MSRGLTPGLVTEVTAKKIRPLVLVKFEFDSGDVRLWNGFRPLTFNSEVYTGSGQLLDITEVQETQVLKAAGVTFTLSGIDASAISIALAENYQGRPVNFWFGALDDDGNIIADPVLQFRGELDVMDLVDDGVEATISVTAQNELVDLERPRERRFNDEDQELEYPEDRFFEFVEGLQEKEITLR